MPVRLQRSHHPRQIRRVISARHFSAAIREQARQIHVRHFPQTLRGQFPTPDRLPCRSHISVRTPHRVDDFPITPALKQQGHNRPVIRHWLPPSKSTTAHHAPPPPRRPDQQPSATSNPECRYQLHGPPLPTEAIRQLASNQVLTAACLLGVLVYDRDSRKCFVGQ